MWRCLDSGRAGPGNPRHLSEFRGVWCESPADLLYNLTEHRAVKLKNFPFFFVCVPWSRWVWDQRDAAAGCCVSLLIQDSLSVCRRLCSLLGAVPVFDRRGWGLWVWQWKTSQNHFVPAGRQGQALRYHCGMLCCWSGERTPSGMRIIPLFWAEPPSAGVPGTRTLHCHLLPLSGKGFSSGWKCVLGEYPFANKYE